MKVGDVDPYTFDGGHVPAMGGDWAGEVNRPLHLLYLLGVDIDSVPTGHRELARSLVHLVTLTPGGGLVDYEFGPAPGIVVPSSNRTSAPFPHLGAETLLNLCSEKYRMLLFDELDAVGGSLAASEAAFIGSLPLVADADLKVLKGNPDAAYKLAREVFPALPESPNQSQKTAPQWIVLSRTIGGQFHCADSGWIARHQQRVRSAMNSGAIGTCSISGKRGPMAKTMPPVKSTSRITDTGQGKAPISDNLRQFGSLDPQRRQLGDARITVQTAELISRGLEQLLNRHDATIAAGRVLYRTPQFSNGRQDTRALSILSTVANEFADPGSDIVTALSRAVRSDWIAETLDADGNKVAPRRTLPIEIRPDLWGDARVLVVLWGGSKAGLKFNRWEERTTDELVDQLGIWTGAAAIAGLGLPRDVASIGKHFPAGAGEAAVRVLISGSPLPAWLLRRALDRLCKHFAGADITSTEVNVSRFVVGLFIASNNNFDPTHITGVEMTNLENPAYVLGAWLGALTAAWKNTGQSKGSGGPASNLRTLMETPAARWGVMLAEWDKKVAQNPARPGWAVGLMRRWATRFAELDVPIPERLDDTEQAMFMLGFTTYDRYGKDTEDSDTTQLELPSEEASR